MPTPKPEATPTELDGVLAEIAAAGEAGDSVTQALVKGVTDALTTMADLVKSVTLAKADVDDDDDTATKPKGKGKAKADPESEGESEGDEAGYEDLALAVPDGYVDVTKLFADVQASINKLVAHRASDDVQLKAMAKSITDLKIEGEGLRQLLAKSIEVNASMQGQLAKGVIGLREDVAQIPEASVTPRRRLQAPPAPAATKVEGEYIGGSELRQRQVLAKGLAEGILNSSQRRMFHLDGVFSEEKSEHERVTAKLTEYAAA